jgi:hypothetical protein
VFVLAGVLGYGGGDAASHRLDVHGLFAHTHLIAAKTKSPAIAKKTANRDKRTFFAPLVGLL